MTEMLLFFVHNMLNHKENTETNASPYVSIVNK